MLCCVDLGLNTKCFHLKQWMKFMISETNFHIHTQLHLLSISDMLLSGLGCSCRSLMDKYLSSFEGVLIGDIKRYLSISKVNTASRMDSLFSMQPFSQLSSSLLWASPQLFKVKFHERTEGRRGEEMSYIHNDYWISTNFLMASDAD